MVGGFDWRQLYEELTIACEYAGLVL